MSDVEAPHPPRQEDRQEGRPIEVKTLVSHVMESGQRKDSAGNVIPRKIINKFTVDLNGKTVFSADIEPAVSANPYMQFKFKARNRARSPSPGSTTTARRSRPRRRSRSPNLLEGEVETARAVRVRGYALG